MESLRLFKFYYKYQSIWDIFNQYLSQMNSEVKQLMDKKEQLEKRLTELEKNITNLNQVHNFQKGTVDAQGFPRADLDFGQFSHYRSLKKQKAQLNNDHFAIMKQIEKHLYALHEGFPDVQPGQQQIKPKQQQIKMPAVTKPKQQPVKKQQQKQHKIDYLTPFAKISIVDHHSPAQKSGIKVGDLLSQFADVNVYAIDFMKEIPGHVHQGKPLKIVVLRLLQQYKTGENIFKLKDDKLYEKITLSITPSKWEGKGLLGCKIDPLHSK